MKAKFYNGFVAKDDYIFCFIPTFVISKCKNGNIELCFCWLNLELVLTF